MLHYAARCAARAAGVNEAGQVAALKLRRLRGAGRDVAWMLIDQTVPVMTMDRAALHAAERLHGDKQARLGTEQGRHQVFGELRCGYDDRLGGAIVQPMLMVARRIGRVGRSAEHTSELQSLMRLSSAVFSLKK